jgi:hypothetical protein
MARKVGARDRLMTANEIEHDAAVDMTRRFARSDLEVSQVDLSHLDIRTRQMEKQLLVNEKGKDSELIQL